MGGAVIYLVVFTVGLFMGYVVAKQEGQRGDKVLSGNN